MPLEGVDCFLRAMLKVERERQSSKQEGRDEQVKCCTRREAMGQHKRSMLFKMRRWNKNAGHHLLKLQCGHTSPAARHVRVSDDRDHHARVTGRGSLQRRIIVGIM